MNSFNSNGEKNDQVSEFMSSALKFIDSLNSHFDRTYEKITNIHTIIWTKNNTLEKNQSHFFSVCTPL